MNFSFFIARRIVFGKQGSNKMSRPVVRISVLAISLGIAVMIISVSVLKGFQQQISEKIIGFGAHIQISPYDNNNSLQANPVSKNQTFYSSIKKLDNVKNIQVYATKGGIIKTKEEIGGIVIKGVSNDYDWEYFKSKIVEGKVLNLKDTSIANGILVSKKTANSLNLKLNDNVIMYFIQQPIRVRKFKLVGIYETGLEEFDNKFAFTNINHIQKLNDWDSTQVAGFEVLLNDFNKLEETSQEVANTVDFNFSVQTIKQIYPQLFDWLSLQDVNVIVIIVMMIIVGLINMITGLLILILERTNMIGILKAMGASNWTLRKVFLLNAFYLIFRGLLFGNMAGIALCLLQKQFGIVKLDQASYYISEVPVLLNWRYIIGLNIITAVVCFIFLLIPSYIITRITPVKAIQFS